MSADLRSPRPRPASASGRGRFYASTAQTAALAPASDAAAAAPADTAARQVASPKYAWHRHGSTSGLGTGGIVGLVVGLVVVVLVGVIVTHCLRTHWRAQRRKRSAAHGYAAERKDLLPLRVRASVRSSFASPMARSQRLSCDTLHSSPAFSTRDRFSQQHEIKTASTVPSAWLYSAAAPIGNMSVRSLALSSPRGTTCHIIDHQRQKESTSTTASSSRTHSSFATGDSSLSALSPPRPTHVRRGTLPYNSIIDSADGLPSPTRTLVDYSDTKIASPRHAMPLAVASPTSRLRAAETYASPQRSPLSLCHDALAVAEAYSAELEPPSMPTSYLMTRQGSAAESALSLPRTVSRAGSIYDVSEHDADVPLDEGAPCRAIGSLLLDLGTESNHAAFGPTPPPTPPRLLLRKNAQASRKAELPATPPSSSGTPSPPAPVRPALSRLQTPRIVMTSADALHPSASPLSAAAREQQEFKDAFMLDLGAGAQPLPLSLMPSPMVERANPFSYPTEASPPRRDDEALAAANRFKVRGGWL
ncbi:hypothetical protein FA09DRAFT_359661 [Tilletiopsis washingtonensis]|uniref:Uncharacterized protein n=1 Tax=Tilletiopsis washingtonensis TaxID=58919 RepID=A0A316ZDE7_9BASI|nr:hypothetical protein FA09DRAFT_359661 [Tilletiopsis washingtonensis]PWN99054.1 hypothetical protein FA09DRAFT_359661 [Tilletiopsis washingtonensis]